MLVLDVLGERGCRRRRVGAVAAVARTDGVAPPNREAGRALRRLELPEPVSVTALQPLIGLPPLVKETLPVGLLPVTVAVNVTLWFTRAGLSELASVVPDGGGPVLVHASTSVRRE